MITLARAKKSGRKFLNPVPTAVGSLSTVAKAAVALIRNREEVIPREPVGPFSTDGTVYDAAPSRGLRITWFGHSSMLIEIDGFKVLTDPIWDQRTGPTQIFGPKRFFPPTLPLAALPRVDVVIVSHDHYDHLAKGTVRTLAGLPQLADARWVTSLGVGELLQTFGVKQRQIEELDWTDSVTIGPVDGGSLTVTSWPARHFSGRGPFDRFHRLWASFVIEGPQHRVYFGADSGPWDGFAEIASRYERFDVVMLEVGAWNQLWGDIHLGPDGAVAAFSAMRERTEAGLLMPIHWGLFNLALHGWRQPMERLELAAAAHDVPLWSPEPGTPTEVGEPLLADWWRRK